MEGPGVLDRFKVPFTYCWSPSLLKKPEDWREHIGEYKDMQTSQVAKSRADVTGFIFDHQEQVDFHPSDDLLCFLENGKEPVYVK